MIGEKFKQFTNPQYQFIMSYIFTEDFLLQTDTARKLYHDYAKELPIIDYHNHLPPQEIAENKSFKNLTEIWLYGDHYKWRAMRAYGVDEKFITGNAGDEEKFKKWAQVVPHTVRNPLFHWTHLELKNPFGIEKYLQPDTAQEIYREANKLLSQENFRPRSLLQHFNVNMLGTTDDPTDNLQYHRQLREENLDFKVRPTFRPDKVLGLNNKDDFRAYIHTLSQVSRVEIKDLDSLLEALANRITYFDESGCVASDNGLSTIPTVGDFTVNELNTAFKAVLEGDDQNAAEFNDSYAFYILSELCKMYFEKNWVQQFHIGPLRNNNTRKYEKLGPDTGFDSIGNVTDVQALSVFLDNLEKQNKLTKTVLYNVNPADNAAFAAMAGNFQGGEIPGKIQYGSAWWFLDQLDGMTDQINILSNTGLISMFIGMLTDSRSFLSYPRHEYFRRLLCNIFAEDMNKGLLPNDLNWMGKIIQDICYYNAKNYFKA